LSDWFWQKFDVFLAALFVASAGVAACQGHAVMSQYIRALSVEVEDAKLHLTDVQGGLRYRVMGPTVRAELEQDAKSRFTHLKRAQDAVADANPLIRPLALARTHDDATLSSTWRGFVPVIPMTAGAVLYALLGAIIGFVIYELIKLPVVAVLEPRRRRFRKRG